ncbi:MAG: hypothetical protein AB1705_00520 [Verrucomicrobiota bacterium]
MSPREHNGWKIAAAACLATAVLVWWPGRERAPHPDAAPGSMRHASHSPSPVQRQRQRPARPDAAASQESSATAASPVAATAPMPMAEPPSTLVWLLKSQTDPLMKARVLEQFRSWGRERGPEAMDYALLQLSGQLRLDGAVEAWRGWAERDVQSASVYAARLLTPGHDYIVYSVAQDFGRQDAAAALAWAMTLVPAEYRSTAAQHVILQWLRQEPAAALAWTADHLGAQPRLNRVERTVLWEAVSYLAGRDLEAAGDWALRLPAGGALESGLHAVLDRWMDHDPAAALAWTETIAPRVEPGVLDESYSAIALRAAGEDHEIGVAWARLISAEDLRDRTLAQIQPTN